MKTGRRSARLRSRMFLKNVLSHTPILGLTFLLVMLWMLFSAALYVSEQSAVGTTITSYGSALYWGIAAFSTAGIADMPVNPASQMIGGIWIVVGSMLFFGAIVATVTAYFMRTLQRPSRQIIDAIEYNLEQLDRLSIDELEMLKTTTDALIENVERLRLQQLDQGGSAPDR